MRELARRSWEVSLFSVTDRSADDRGELDRLFRDVIVAPLGRGRTRRLARLALDSVLSQPFERRYFHSRGAERRLRASLATEDIDVVVAGQLYTYPYAEAFPAERTVFDSHNVEARRVGTMVAAGGVRGLLAKRQQRPAASYEEAVVRRVARTWAVSGEERGHFEALAPGRVDLVPNGVDCSALPMRGDLPPGREVLFLGRMDYGANLDAVRFLLESVARHLGGTGCEIKVVGAGPPRSLTALARDAPVAVEVTGFVRDTRPFLDRARLMIVPLRIGGGTRLKILEALARGVPVVTTTLGCEGLGLEDGRHALIADGPEPLAFAVQRLLRDDELCRSLADEGRRHVQERFDWSRIGELASRSLERIL
jgi:polysaccharide biosynthesis protein PslH